MTKEGYWIYKYPKGTFFHISPESTVRGRVSRGNQSPPFRIIVVRKLGTKEEAEKLQRALNLL